jgi:hypothetical protein
VGQPFRGELVDGEAHALDPLRVHEHEPAGVLQVLPLRLRRERLPDARQLGPRPEREVEAARHPLLREEGPRAFGRVARRVDRDGHRRHVPPELVEGPLDLLGLHRAGVLAGGVEEGHDHGLPAMLGQRDRLAVLVAKAEVGGAQPARQRGSLEAERTLALRPVVRALGRHDNRAEGEHGDEHQGDDHAGVHAVSA